jgi:hypothetical protein
MLETASGSGYGRLFTPKMPIFGAKCCWNVTFFARNPWLGPGVRNHDAHCRQKHLIFALRRKLTSLLSRPLQPQTAARLPRRRASRSVEFRPGPTGSANPFRLMMATAAGINLSGGRSHPRRIARGCPSAARRGAASRDQRCGPSNSITASAGRKRGGRASRSAPGAHCRQTSLLRIQSRKILPLTPVNIGDCSTTESRRRGRRPWGRLWATERTRSRGNKRHGRWPCALRPVTILIELG